MSEHTPTPWRYEAFRGQEDEPEAFAHIWSRDSGWKLATCEAWASDEHDAEANAARIVACVNAFPDDIPTSAIREGMVREMVDLIHALGMCINGLCVTLDKGDRYPGDAERRADQVAAARTKSAKVSALLASLKPEPEKSDG